MDINTINYLIVMLKNYLKQARERYRKREGDASRAPLYRAYIHTYIDWANPEPTRPKKKKQNKKQTQYFPRGSKGRVS